MINLKWNNKEKCVEVARVLFIKDFILDKTQKRVQDAEMRAGSPERSSGDCDYDIIKQNKGGKNESIFD
jgi:hypothetical protein